MSEETLKTILEDDTLSDDQISVLLERSKKLARNRHFWKEDDIPTETELERFYDRYEYEIYGIAKSVNADSARDGEIRHEELGIVRVWDKSGSSEVVNAINQIPPRTYIV